MFNKCTTFSIKSTDIEWLDNDIVKTASYNMLPPGHQYDPEFLYMLVRAVSAGEYFGCNKNADYFPEAELLANYKSFLEGHVFKNHENKLIEGAIGQFLDAIWNDKMKYVQLLIRVDRQIAPAIVRGFEKGFMTDVSMGCKIKHSICSICGNIAKVQSEYCDHIKYQKHQVLMDGRRVYEINIGPRFHDISAVLSGADRTAKMTGLIIMGDKVAFVDQEQVEKVASFKDSFIDKSDIEKVASDGDGEESSFDFNLIMTNPHNTLKTASEREKAMLKIAEIKKEIKGKILAVANGRHVDKAFANVRDLIELFKIFGTDFLDNKKCVEIASKLRVMADAQEVPLEQAFGAFIKVLNVAGIELSPIEFKCILRNLTVGDELEDSDDDIIGDPLSLKRTNDEITDNYGDDINMPTMFNLAKHISRYMTILLPSRNVGNNMRVMCLALRKPGLLRSEPLVQFRPDIDVPSLNSSIIDMIRPLITGRSMHRTHLLPRMLKFASSDEYNYDNIAHFVGADVLEKTANEINSKQVALDAYVYACYQRNRLNSLTDEFEDATFKIAEELGLNDSIIEKTANILGKGYSHRKALIIGMPLTYGYSSVQQSRMQNGENVSPLNRYIAQNPANAYFVQAILGPKGWKYISKLKGKGADAINILKQSNEDALTYLCKEASDIEVTDNLPEIDMFKNNDINKELGEVYSAEQINTIKLATLVYGMEREDLADELLVKQALTTSDISNYLHICENCFTIEVEKRAGFAGDTALTILQDSLFLPAKIPMVASLPFEMADSLALNALSKKKSVKLQAAENVDKAVNSGVPPIINLKV